MEYDQKLIQRIRSFNRFYTSMIGLLDQHFLDSPFSLTEGRVLYEICHIKDCTAKKIRERLVIDEGYLSRIIDSFIKRGLIGKTPAPDDRRLHIIVPTERGKKEFSRLNASQNELLFRMIETLSQAEREELVEMMERIRGLLSRERPVRN